MFMNSAEMKKLKELEDEKQRILSGMSSSQVAQKNVRDTHHCSVVGRSVDGH